jgi:cytochrome P450
VLTDRTGLFAKDFMIPVFKVLLGNGLILANGDDWKRHRKVVLPAFNHERIKVVVLVINHHHHKFCTYIYRQILATDDDIVPAVGLEFRACRQ